MRSAQVNADDRLYGLMLRVKHHLRVCQSCRGALKARDQLRMCELMTDMLVDMVQRFDRVLSLRILANKSGNQVVYPCPELRRHGRAYEYSAEPVIVTHVQSALF